MNPTKTLHRLGQSPWPDDITRTPLRSGALTRLREKCNSPAVRA